MFTISLIAAPGKLSASKAEGLRCSLSGGALRWLAQDEAAEFPIHAKPANWERLQESLDQEGVDLNILPSSNRVKKLLIADMDSTMIEQECIDELADAAGAGAEVAEVTERAMRGELEFEAALEERVAKLKGQPVSLIENVLADRITSTPGGAELITSMRAGGATCHLVSGGFTIFAAAIAARLGFDTHAANRLVFAEGRLTGEVDNPILGREAKRERLKRLVKDHDISAEDVIAVGDGANDLSMLDLAGLGVAFRAKPIVAAQADARINHGDLTALLYLQGHSKPR